MELKDKDILYISYIKYYREAQDAMKNDNYLSKYMDVMKNDESIVNSGLYDKLEKMSIYDQVLNATWYYVGQKLTDNGILNFDSSDLRTDDQYIQNASIVKFLNDDEAKKEYKTTKARNDTNIEELNNKFLSLSETSFFNTNKVFDNTNTYSGEKFKIIDNTVDILTDTILKENDELNELYKDDPLYKDMKDPFLNDIYTSFTDIIGYFNKVNTELNPEVIENSMRDSSIVDINTYGLEKYDNASVIESTQKFGAEYIKKEWLSSDVYQNYEAVDMSDKYKYGSMDKNTQFSNAMKFAQIFGVDEEGQKTEQFQQDSLLFNEIYYSGLDYLTDSFNLTQNFNYATDKTAINMAKDFFGDEFDNIIPEYGQDNVNISINRDSLEQNITHNVINMMTFVDNEDDLTKGLQCTQDYITNIKYLDKNKDSLTYLESKLDIGSSAENYDAMIKYNLVLEDNERDREELLKYFEMIVKGLEETNTIDEYIDYDKKDSLPSIVSPIFRKTVYA